MYPVCDIVSEPVTISVTLYISSSLVKFDGQQCQRHLIDHWRHQEYNQ